MRSTEKWTLPCWRPFLGPGDPPSLGPGWRCVGNKAAVLFLWILYVGRLCQMPLCKLCWSLADSNAQIQRPSTSSASIPGKIPAAEADPILVDECTTDDHVDNQNHNEIPASEVDPILVDEHMTDNHDDHNQSRWQTQSWWWSQSRWQDWSAFSPWQKPLFSAEASRRSTRQQEQWRLSSMVFSFPCLV